MELEPGTQSDCVLKLLKEKGAKTKEEISSALGIVQVWGLLTKLVEAKKITLNEKTEKYSLVEEKEQFRGSTVYALTFVVVTVLILVVF